jgi:CubicO group peptidase (beta-lactamase class C family)
MGTIGAATRGLVSHRKGKGLAAFLLATLVALGAGAEGRPGEALPAPAELRAFFEDYLGKKLRDLGIAGAVATVVEEGKIVFQEGYGYADLAKKVPVDPARTLFRIGSMSKVFAWTAVMQLVERGLVDLDRDVNDYLDFEIPGTFARPVTLRSLMAHASGFEDRSYGQMAEEAGGLVPLGSWLKARLPARLRARDELPAYANYGAALAGYIVERVSGLPYEEYLEREIFSPLGMSRSTGRQPLPASLAGDAARGYALVGGSPSDWGDEFLNPAPAGAIRSTASDIAAFMIAHLEGGKGILEGATERLMLERSFSADPRVNGWAHGLMEMDLGGERIVGHAGSTFVFNSVTMLFPARRLGVFVATNSRPGSAFLGGGYMAMRRDFAARFFPRARVGARASDAPSAAEFAGSYRQTMGECASTAERLSSYLMSVRIRAEGKDLVASLPGGETRFIRAGSDLFLQEDTGDPLVFKKGAGGRIVALWNAAPLTALVEQRPWETPLFVFAALAFCLLVFAAYLLASPILAAARRVGRRRGQLGSPSPLERAADWSGAAASAFGLALALCAASSLLDARGLYTARLPLWGLVGALSILESLATGAIAVCAVLAWKKRSWNLALRVMYTIVAAAAIGFDGLKALLHWTGGAL